jgi:DNA polymerase III sliding clamp (beta) subunit (PCNA family)
MNPIIELPVAEWKTALTGLAKVISKRTSLPVLEHLRVTRTAAGVLTLQATDLDVSACYQAQAPNIGEPCDFLVPFAPLNQAVKGSKETVQLIAEANGPVRLRTFVGASPMEQSFATLPVDEFPPAPLVTGKPVSLDATFRDSFRQALDCCSDDAGRHVIQHVCLDTRHAEGHYLAASDGHHLFCANSFKFDLKAPVLISDLPFLRWTKFMEDGAIELCVKPKTKTEGPWVQLKSGPWTFISKSCGDEFPTWKNAVPAPNSGRTRIQLDGGAVATLLAGVPRLPGGDEVNRPVTLEIAGSTLTVKAQAKGAEDWTCLTVAGATLTGKSVSIALNRDYLLKALRFGLTTVAIEDDLTLLDFYEGGRRMIVSPVRPPEPPAVPQPATPVSSDHSPCETPASAMPSAQPVATPTAATQAPMPPTPTPPERGTRSLAPVNGETQSAFAAVVTHLDGVKAKLRDVMTELNGTLTLLKTAEKEQRVSAKEVESVRATLRSLQRMQV